MSNLPADKEIGLKLRDALAKKVPPSEVITSVLFGIRVQPKPQAPESTPDAPKS